MEHQRLVAEHEELVEGEAGRRNDLRHMGGNPIDAVGDLVDLGFHFTASLGSEKDAAPPRTLMGVDAGLISRYGGV